MEVEARVADVQAFKTKSGNTRFVLRDESGTEYTTFREEVARQALAAQGRRARITFHESSRGGYHNVYLDSVELVEPDAGADDEAVDEVAWKTAVDAAPWLVGGAPPEGGVPPDEFFDKLKRFKELVADDIRSEDDETRD